MSTKVSDLAALAANALASGDLVVVVDVSDTTMAASGTNKRITLANLFSGVAGGKTVIGGSASGEDMTLQSTSNATKGSVFLGAAQTSVYDEVNDRLGIGTNAPAVELDINGAGKFSGDLELKNGTTTTDGALAFDRTNEDLSIGDGAASQIVHMGAWKTWTPVFTGFSTDPSSVTARYSQIGKTVIVHFDTNNGTSNATTFTITLPVAAANTAKQRISMALATNNGTNAAGGGLLLTRLNSTTADLYKDHALGTWSNVGAKKVQGTFIYEAA